VITSGEFSLLAAFVRSTRNAAAVTGSALIDSRRGPGSETDSRSMDVQVSRCAALKSQPDAQPSRYLQNVWGYGYVFVLTLPRSPDHRRPLLRPVALVAGLGVVFSGWLGFQSFWCSKACWGPGSAGPSGADGPQVALNLRLSSLALENAFPPSSHQCLQLGMGIPPASDQQRGFLGRKLDNTPQPAGGAQLKARTLSPLARCPQVVPTHGHGPGRLIELASRWSRSWLYAGIRPQLGWPPDLAGPPSR